MGSGFPTQNYLPLLRNCNRQFMNPSDSQFQNFKKPSFSGAMNNPIRKLPAASTNRFRQSRMNGAEHCIQFKRGKCNYGTKCVYPHIAPLENRNLFESFKAEEKREEMMNRARVCMWVFNGKECPYGNQCRFSHDNVLGGFGFKRENNAVILVDSVNVEKRMRPETWSSNATKLEDKYVVRKKTRLCVNWNSSGACNYGAKCTFAHGKAELQHTKTIPIVKPSNSLAAKPLGNVAGSCKKTRTVDANLEKGNKCYFKWNSVNKIREVYADWIDNIEPVNVSSV